MQDLAGKTVIVRTYEATLKTNLFDDVYVVTDSEIIFKEIELCGGKAIMSKKEHECGSDRIAEAVEYMDFVFGDDIPKRPVGIASCAVEHDRRGCLGYVYIGLR